MWDKYIDRLENTFYIITFICSTCVLHFSLFKKCFFFFFTSFRYILLSLIFYFNSNTKSKRSVGRQVCFKKFLCLIQCGYNITYKNIFNTCWFSALYGRNRRSKKKMIVKEKERDGHKMKKRWYMWKMALVCVSLRYSLHFFYRYTVYTYCIL